MENTAKRIEPYTYQQYRQTPTEERLEIIDGIVCGISPSPSVKHQRVVMGFGNVMYSFFKRKDVYAFHCPHGCGVG